VGETTGSAWIGAYRDAVVDCRVACRDAVWGSGGACRDADLDSRDACRDAVAVDSVDVTTGLCCGEVFHDASLGGIVDVTTDPYRGEACRDADLGGTVGVTTGPVLRVFDTMGVTTGSYLAILRCDATMLVLGGDIVGETTNSLIMSLYSP